MRDFFMKTERIGFSKWNEEDIDLAIQLWGDKEVTQFICATGVFTDEDIHQRLKTEIVNDKQLHIQYWPIFKRSTEELIGCCGIHPSQSEIQSYELGFHLCKKFWGMGYASEAAKAVINYSFETLKAKKLYAGHHPQNKASEKLLTKLGFLYAGGNYFKPTGLYHLWYELVNNKETNIEEKEITISAESPFSTEAISLLNELSNCLEDITGDNGNSSFDSNDVCNDKAIFVIARNHSGKAIGCGAFRPMNEKTAEVKRMYAKEKGMGIGNKILSYLECQAVHMGYRSLRLETRIVNTKAVLFYRKNGYKEIPNYGKYENNINAICFEKDLSS